MSGEAVIGGAAEAQYTRHPDPTTTTETLLVGAVSGALESAGLNRDDVDGLGVASFTLKPDHVIDLAWRLGMRLAWIMEDANGGAASINMLQHALRAIKAEDASTIVLVAGDRMCPEDFIDLRDNYNKATRDHLAPIPFYGPNTLFAFLTQRHMRAHGLERKDYGYISVSQRRWASKNPGAVYRAPLTIEEYLAAPIVADPLGRYDCVPVVSGADAIVVTTRERVPPRAAVTVKAILGSYNPDQQEGDGLQTGLAPLAADFWSETGMRPEDVDLACVYDDYPVMVLVQLADLGFIPDGDLRLFLRKQLGEDEWPLNTSGGQLSAGQAGAAGGMHGLVEAVRQLRGEGGDRQVAGARAALVTGYGMVLYRYGACANAALLERAP